MRRAAARLVGVIPRDSLAQAIRDELAHLGEAVVTRDLEMALGAYDHLAEHTGCVQEPQRPRQIPMRNHAGSSAL